MHMPTWKVGDFSRSFPKFDMDLQNWYQTLVWKQLSSLIALLEIFSNFDVLHLEGFFFFNKIELVLIMAVSYTGWANEIYIFNVSCPESKFNERYNACQQLYLTICEDFSSPFFRNIFKHTELKGSIVLKIASLISGITVLVCLIRPISLIHFHFEATKDWIWFLLQIQREENIRMGV